MIKNKEMKVLDSVGDAVKFEILTVRAVGKKKKMMRASTVIHIQGEITLEDSKMKKNLILSIQKKILQIADDIKEIQ